MTARRWAAPRLLAGPLLVGPLLVGLLLAGCDAPLEPEAKQGRAEVGTRGPAPTGPATPATPATSPARPPATTRPSPSAPPPPSISVPAELRSPGPDRPVLGADASWPQCPKGMGIPEKRTLGAPMPLPQAEYVVLGLTNGPGFVANPCLADQVAWAERRHLWTAAYSIISWPDGRTRGRYGDDGPFDGGTRLGALANVGYQQARFNVATLQRVGLETPVVWLDVEPVPKFEWSSDTVANAAVVRGAARGYQDAGYRIGVYSTQYLWQQVVGSLRLGLPEWRAAGQTSRAEALRRCGRSAMFQGGRAVLSQWVEADRDQDVTCPGTSPLMGRWFHRS